MLRTRVLVVLALFMATSSSFAADYESVAFTVEDYGVCGAGDLWWTHNENDEITEGFDDINYDQTASWKDINVELVDFRDAERDTPGYDNVDPTGTDWADVIFFSGHGFHECFESYDYSRIIMGNSWGCEVYPNSDMLLGEGGSGDEANIMILFACETAQYCVWQSGSYSDIPAYSGSFTMLAGFHGISYDYFQNGGRLKGWVTGSTTDAIGDAYIDNFYNPWYAVGNYDQCPTVIVWGSTAAAKDSMFFHGGFKDFKNTGYKMGSTYYYISGCNPDAGEELP